MNKLQFERRARRLGGPCALLVLIVLLLAGCGGGDAGSPALAAPSELTGLIREIHGEGSAVSSLTLEAGGDVYDIRMKPGYDYGFDLSHLREHASSRWPIRCSVEQRNGALYAVAIYDA